MKNLLLLAFSLIFSISLISQTDVLPPVLDKPANAGANQMPDVQLDWFAVSGIGTITYEVYLDTTDTFPNPVIFSTTNSAQKANELLFGQEYFWKVRATDDNGTGDWSLTRSFTVFSIIVLDDPSSGDTAVMPDVTLEWKNKKGATFISGLTYYDYELSLTNDFANSYIDSVAFGTYPANAEIYKIQTSGLLFDTTYYWRVRARHSLDVTEWSDPWSFSTISGVHLVSPSNDTINQNPDVELKWDAISGVVKFIYQVCTDPNFTFPCITNFTESNSVIVPSLLFGATYHWRVQGIHLQDTTEWSQARSFQVINTVLLESPANGVAGIDPLPTLKWKYIRGTDEYEILWNNQDLTILDTAYVDTSFFLMFKPLDMGDDYFWKVRAINNVDTTEWSPTWQFHTGPQGIVDFSLSGDMISLYPNPSNGILNIEMNSEKPSNVQITILDFIGRIVYEQKHSFDKGFETLKVDLSGMSNGLYFIRFSSGEAVYTKKLVIDK
jgi:hypothetical protein